MKTPNALAKILAWHAGHPLPCGSTLPLRRVPARDRLLVAFLSMGGETATWGVIWGHPGATPRMATTPDPRNRKAVATMLVPFAADVLAHLPHPTQLEPGAVEKITARANQRQIWLPGAAHVDVLHVLQYRLQSASEPEKHSELLRALGRACGWLFRESCRPGQQRVVDAAGLLREIHTFPADEVHLAHLGFELAWLDTPGDRAARIQAASVAEEASVGTTLHPAFEREHIEPALDAYAALDPDCQEAKRLTETIRKHLQDELLRRWCLLEKASTRVNAEARPSTPNLEALDAEASYLFGRFWDDECARLRGEDGFDVHAETDGQIPAAQGYLCQQRSQDDLLQVMLHGDAQRLEEAVLAGDAVRGVLTSVVRTGRGNCRRTRWTLETSADVPLRLRQDGSVCPVGVPKMKILVRGIQQRAGRRLVHLEVTGQYESGLGVGFPAADDTGSLVGREVTLVHSAKGQILLGKAKRLSQKQGPGDWLTVADPVPPAARPRPRSEDVLAIVEGLRGGA
jgi:hypothetical protein